MDLLGPWAPLRPGSHEVRLDGEISLAYLTSLGHTIAGGTAEVLRTTVAVRVSVFSPSRGRPDGLSSLARPAAARRHRARLPEEALSPRAGAARGARRA